MILLDEANEGMSSKSISGFSEDENELIASLDEDRFRQPVGHPLMDHDALWDLIDEEKDANELDVSFTSDYEGIGALLDEEDEPDSTTISLLGDHEPLSQINEDLEFLFQGEDPSLEETMNFEGLDEHSVDTDEDEDSPRFHSNGDSLTDCDA
ncbi:hypothetical protein FRB91_005591 [Serendipita sp. 411]|nr:hypothetical protein FRB91_005591 [Serendipita sp. 411]